MRGRLETDARMRARGHVGSREPIRGYVQAAARRDTICEGEKTERERKRTSSRNRKAKRRLVNPSSESQKHIKKMKGKSGAAIAYLQ